MAVKYYNPYSDVGTQFTDGLNYIIANYPGTGAADFGNFNTIVVGYIQTLLDPTTIPPATLPPLFADLTLAVLPNSVNEYINTQVGLNLSTNTVQTALINSIYDGILSNSIESLGDYFDSVDELITSADYISTVDKTPLYIATVIAAASYNFWITVVAAPGGWATYLNANTAINYANIPKWVAISFTSALSGYSQILGASVSGVLTNDRGRFLASPMSIGAAMGVTAGKIIFNWAQRPLVNCGG